MSVTSDDPAASSLTSRPAEPAPARRADAQSDVLEAPGDSERHHRLLFETMLQGVMFQDAEGRIISMNPAAERILGRSAAECVGRTLVSLEHHCVRVDGTAFPALEHPSMVALRTGTAVSGVVMGVFNPREQRYRWVAISAVPLAPEGELHPHEVYTLFDDVTPRLLAETELRRAKEEWEQTFNAVPDMLAIVDDQYRMVRVNRAMAEGVGREPEECVGEYCYEVVHELSGPPANCPHALTRVDGQAHAAEIWEPHFGRELQVTSSPRYDSQGRLIGAVHVARDITHRKRAEQALRDNEERWREAVESAEMGAWEIDLRHSTAWLSPRLEEIFGEKLSVPDWAPDLFLGRVLPEDRPLVEAHLQHALSKRLPWCFECRIRHSDGTVRWIWVHGRQRYDEQNQPVRIFGLVQDISARKELEGERERHLAAIEEANRAKDLFFNILSHELRTPLTAMLNSVEVLKNTEASAVHRERALTVLERNIRHQTRLIDDLLDLSRIMRGKVDIQRELLDLRELVGSQLEALEVEARKARLSLRASLPERPVRIAGDAVRLGQVISNLLTNAVKFTEAGGSIHVQVCVEDCQAVVRVRDTGIGLSREMLPRVFEPFRQAESSRPRGKGGLGIGLAVARSLAELHGGGLQAASAGLGEGSEFTLRLPLFDDRAAVSQRARAESVEVCGRQRRVLVVEDNPDVRETLSILLGLMGHIALQAADGTSALELAARERPDTALIDIGLPDMDGYQLARALRAAALGDIRLCALTGHVTPEARERAQTAGFDHHLAKPVEAAELQRVIDGDLPPAGAWRPAERKGRRPRRKRPCSGPG